RGAAREIITGSLFLQHWALQLVLMGHVVDEAGHQIEDARLVRIVARAHPAVRDVAVIEGVLSVGELTRHGGAQDQPVSLLLTAFARLSELWKPSSPSPAASNRRFSTEP